MSPPISVVIPTLDEEAHVATAIRSVRDHAEVVVVDGGSRDGTVAAAAAEGARVLRSPRGRGLQLALGARETRSPWLVFLHADTWLEKGWADALHAAGPEIVGGAFRFAVDAPRPSYRVLEAGVALRCRLFRLPYGDQGIFARRSAYDEIGGVPPLPLMEDVAFVRRLGRAGRLTFPSARAFTSARRWERQGVAATTIKNLSLVARYALGASPERLARAYDGRPLADARPAEEGG